MSFFDAIQQIVLLMLTFQTRVKVKTFLIFDGVKNRRKKQNIWVSLLKEWNMFTLLSEQQNIEE